MHFGFVAEVREAQLGVAVQFVETEQHAVFLARVPLAEICQDAIPGIGVGRGFG